MDMFKICLYIWRKYEIFNHIFGSLGIVFVFYDGGQPIPPADESSRNHSPKVSFLDRVIYFAVCSCSCFWPGHRMIFVAEELSFFPSSIENDFFGYLFDAGYLQFCADIGQVCLTVTWQVCDRAHSRIHRDLKPLTLRDV